MALGAAIKAATEAGVAHPAFHLASGEKGSKFIEDARSWLQKVRDASPACRTPLAPQGPPISSPRARTGRHGIWSMPSVPTQVENSR